MKIHSLFTLLVILFAAVVHTTVCGQPAVWAPASSIANDEGGDGSTPAEAIRIATAPELAYLAMQANAGGTTLLLDNATLHTGNNEGFAHTYFRLATGIDLGGREWTPIATGAATDIAPSFCGTFDGNGHTIKGLAVPHSTGLAGLFGYIGREGIVQNLHVITYGVYSPNSYAGGIAGWNDGTIRRCLVTGTGQINGSTAGGITGTNSNALSDCYATINVSGEHAGGIAGSNPADTLNYCFATGIVIATRYAGGIAAYNGINGTIRHCLALNTNGITVATGKDNRSARIVADNDGDLLCNYASPDTPGSWKLIGSNAEDGANLTPATFNTTSRATGVFAKWNTDVWYFDPSDVYLPSLRTTDGRPFDDQPVLTRTEYSSN